MKAVYRYKLSPNQLGKSVEMPAGATVIGIDGSSNVPTVTALVDPEEDQTEHRHFVVARTGQNLPDVVLDDIFLGTCQHIEFDEQAGPIPVPKNIYKLHVFETHDLAAWKNFLTATS